MSIKALCKNALIDANQAVNVLSADQAVNAVTAVGGQWQVSGHKGLERKVPFG